MCVTRLVSPVAVSCATTPPFAFASRNKSMLELLEEFSRPESPPASPFRILSSNLEESSFDHDEMASLFPSQLSPNHDVSSSQQEEMLGDDVDMFPSQCSISFSDCGLLSQDFLPSTTTTNEVDEMQVLAIVDRTFANVPKDAVRQDSGRLQGNVGEILPFGLAKVLACVHVDATDVFVDIGCGLGNVLVHVALATTASCIGVEMRTEVLGHGLAAIEAQMHDSPALAKIQFYGKRVEDMEEEHLADSTILYAFNSLFDPSTNVHLEHLACVLPKLRVFICSVLQCPRHSTRCTNHFCAYWRLDKTVLVDVSYTSKLVALHMYKKILVNL